MKNLIKKLNPVRSRKGSQRAFTSDGINWEKVSGLVPAIIQDSSTGLVLMLCYMNKEALTKTMKTGFVWFYSRTKKKLSMKTDCDNDTLLIKASPAGPICHTGKMTCFSENAKSDSIKDLFATILR